LNCERHDYYAKISWKQTILIIAWENTSLSKVTKNAHFRVSAQSHLLFPVLLLPVHFLHPTRNNDGGDASACIPICGRNIPATLICAEASHNKSVISYHDDE
jgi:hypothetical protein